MNGAKIGEGLGCLAVFAGLGLLAAIYVVIKVCIWVYTHIQIN